MFEKLIPLPESFSHPLSALMALNTRRSLSVLLLSLSVLLFLLATLTPIFTPILSHLPPHTDLFFHLLFHSIFTIALLPLLASVPPEAICLLSVLFAALVELLQYAFVDDRSPEFADFLAGVLGSCAVFLTPRDGRIVRPSYAALVAYLAEDDEDDDHDSHRVASWAV